MQSVKLSHHNEKGFVLVGLLFVMVILAVIALGLNRQTGMQQKMGANQTRSTQNYLGQLACIEDTIWRLKQDPNWRPNLYTDLHFVNSPGNANDTVTTSGGNFEQDGFAAGDRIAIMHSAPYNDGFFTVLAVAGNTIEVASNTLFSGGAGSGVATIEVLIGPEKIYFELTFVQGAACANDKIIRASGNFKGDGFTRGDKIAIFDAWTINEDIYNIAAISDTGNTIEIEHGSLTNGGTDYAKIAVMRGQRYVYNGMPYYRKLWNTRVCDTGDFIGLSCASPGGRQAVTDLIQIHLWQDFYITDTENHRIRKVDNAQNMITTLAGNSTEDRLLKPAGVWVDAANNIYIADTQNHYIRKIVHTTGAIRIIAGNGDGGYSGDDVPALDSALNNPYSVSVDSAGNIYIADTGNRRIRRVDAITGTVTTVAGNGVDGYSGDGVPATSTRLNDPKGVVKDSAGNIYIADTENNRIRRVDAASGIITTVAGNGAAGFWGDATPPTGAQIQAARNVRVDGAGNLYIVDGPNHRIRKVTAEVDAETGFRLITTVAGNGAGTYGGDEGPATAASLRNPHDAWVDSAGNILIADTENNRIRKVDAASGLISTVAGGGDPVDGLGDGGPAGGAKLNKPRGVYVDINGDIFIADDGHHRVRKVNAASGIITTVAGNGDGGYLTDGVPATATRLNHPYGVHGDAAGNIYIADKDNKRIRKVSAENGFITTVAGNGDGTYLGDGLPATATGLNKPPGIFLDAVGNLYIADTDNNCIRKVDAVSGIITTVAGNGDEGYLADGVPATATRLDHPAGAHVDAGGNIYIADTDNKRIRKVDNTSGMITTVVGTGSAGYWGDAVPATQAELDRPNGIFVDAGGNIYIADTENRRIRKVHAIQGIITTIAGNGLSTYAGDNGPAVDASFRNPAGLWVDTTGNIYIADTENQRIRKVDIETGIIDTIIGNGSSGYTGDGGPAIDATLRDPGDVCVNAAGDIIIADTVNNSIREVYADTGLISTVAGEASGGFSGDGVPATATKLYFPGDISRDASGHFYIADTENNRIRKINAVTGIIETVAGNGLRSYSGDGGPATDAALKQPAGVSIDASGSIFIADTENHRIRKVDYDSGVITTVAGNGDSGFSGDDVPASGTKLNKPRGVYVDAAGNIFIADTENSRIRKVDADTGMITTVAGNGDRGYDGDNGPATGAELNKPNDLWVDTTGNIYIADTENHRIRRVDVATGLITTVAGNGSSDYAGDNGPAIEASLRKPAGISVDADGNLYISDTENQCIRRVDAASGIIRRVAGRDEDNGFSGDGGKPNDAKLNFPRGIWADQGASGGSGIVRP
jgi:sugar lactone lactonase YvrE